MIIFYHAIAPVCWQTAVCLITIQSGLKVQGLLLFCKAQYTKVYEHLQKVA